MVERVRYAKRVWEWKINRKKHIFISRELLEHGGNCVDTQVGNSKKQIAAKQMYASYPGHPHILTQHTSSGSLCASRQYLCRRPSPKGHVQQSKVVAGRRLSSLLLAALFPKALYFDTLHCQWL